jgi:mRNA interferase MazF
MTTTTPRGPGCRRGDVALVVFPDSNLRTAKLRPVLVVQADDLGTGLSQVIVAMITSNLSRAGHGAASRFSAQPPKDGSPGCSPTPS